MEDIFITDGGPVRVGVCTGSTPRPWQEDVLRSREALELLALITAVENVTTLPLLPPPPTRRLLVSSSSRDIPADVPDVEVFQAFFLAFDECILRAELRDAIQQVFNQVPPAKRDEVARKWRIPTDFYVDHASWIKFVGGVLDVGTGARKPTRLMTMSRREIPGLRS